ncbi:hypothetical protein [Capnocytophaga canimorsus]|uniref:hypothetical protein n=1 Tax=Capnocytophaga canimorsus TaxID=28188 RepID=UPI0037D115E1
MALAIVSVGAYAQAPANKAVKGTPPSKSLNCGADNAQNPIVGKKYTYAVDGPEGNYHFLATNQTTFIENKSLKTDGAYVDGNQIKVGANYNNPTSTEKSIDITWTNSAAGTSYLVVNHTPKTGCTTTNNLKVLEIKPKNAFFIELRNIDKDGTKAISDVSNVNVCLGQIESAQIQGDKVKYNYGEQSLFYELIAVNYDKTFKPQIKVQGLKEGQTATLKWGYSKDAINSVLPNTIDKDTDNNVIDIDVITALETATPSEGVSIYFELVVKNGSFEGLVDQEIILLADATTGANNSNNVNESCTQESEFADKAIQTLLKRSTITAQGGLNFIQSAP